MVKERKRLPVGVENFEQIINDNYYYVDKTGLISELLRNGGMVNLFTRPRRFGKTLNMSMLEHFFPEREIRVSLTDWKFQKIQNCVKSIWENIRLFQFP